MANNLQYCYICGIDHDTFEKQAQVSKDDGVIMMYYDVIMMHYDVIRYSIVRLSLFFLPYRVFETMCFMITTNGIMFILSCT